MFIIDSFRFGAAGPAPLSLGADPGTYAISGSAATLRRTYIVPLSSGSYAISGTDAAIRQSVYRLSAGAGSYTITGAAAALLKASKVTAGAGSYALTGTAATLTKTSPAPLDGTSPTGAWSSSRDLLTSFIGNPRYTTATGANSLKDQTGGGRTFDQTSTGSQPTVGTMGPNSRTSLNFDGVDDYLSCSADLSNHITATDGFIIASCMVNSISTDSATPYSNQVIIGDNSGYMGIGLRTTGPEVEAYNFNGSFWDKPVSTISTGVPLVVTWRHQGGNLYVSVNGGAEVSHSSGNTGGLNTRVGIAHAIGGYADMKFVEMAMFNSGSTPDATTRAAIIADFMNHTGAV